MKVFISADIEGISGVVSKAHTTSQGYDYQRARMLMTQEVNAAIEGALDAGADEILVNDAHGSMTNILIEELNPKASLITGTPKMLGMMEGIDSSFDAALFIGYHSRMNSSGILSHTYYGSVVSDITINGKASGEFYINSSVAGSFGVPVVLVSGDDVLKEEVLDINEDIESVVVKTAQGRYAAKCIAPLNARNLIRERTREALNQIEKIKITQTEGPIELKIRFLNSGFAEVASLMPRTTLAESSVVAFTAENIVECYRAVMALIKIAASLL